MKIAIPIENQKVKSRLSNVFARSKYFALVDTLSKKLEFIDNPYYKDKLRVGENVVWYLSQKGIKGFASYEFGLRLQTETKKHKIQLVLINSDYKSLHSLLELIQNY